MSAVGTSSRPEGPTTGRLRTSSRSFSQKPTIKQSLRSLSLSLYTGQIYTRSFNCANKFSHLLIGNASSISRKKNLIHQFYAYLLITFHLRRDVYIYIYNLGGRNCCCTVRLVKVTQTGFFFWFRKKISSSK